MNHLRRSVLALPVFVLALVLTLALPAFADSATVALYSGWAGPHGGKVYGRVLEGKPPPLPKPGQSSWRSLMDNVIALEKGKGIEGAKLSISGIPGLTSAVAGTNGFFTLLVPANLAPGALKVTVSATAHERVAAPVTISVPVWDDAPGLAVVSDIDDTVLDSKVTHKFELLKNTLLNTPFTMKTFPGTKDLLATADAGHRPIFYLSGSPWSLHDRTQEFFDLQGFPHGTVILRRYSAESLDPFEFKHPHLLELFDAFPHKKFILLGDDGEKDPEVYAAVRKERPGRVQAVYIHDVTGAKSTDGRFAGMKLFADWTKGAKDLAASGNAK